MALLKVQVNLYFAEEQNKDVKILKSRLQVFTSLSSTQIMKHGRPWQSICQLKLLVLLSS